MGELGVWIFLSVYVVCDTTMYLKGHDTLLFKHKTKAEKAIRRKQTGLDDDDENP